MKVTLLHIEDNEDDQLMLREYLTGPGMDFRIETAATVAAGLKRLRQTSVDVILADLSLPDSSGMDTFTRLHEAAPDIPIVLLTGNDDEDFAVELLARGAQDYLPKEDASQRTLARAVRYAVERKRGETDLKVALEKQKSGQEQLKRAEKRFRLVVEASPHAMVMVGDDGRIALVNSQAGKLFGYDRGELIGQPVEILVPQRSRAAHTDENKNFFHAPAERPMGHNRDLSGIRKDGTELPLEIGLSPISSPDGNFVLASIIDLTERKTYENNLKSSLNEKLALLQEVHHRVKNNLQIICSLLSLQANSVEDQQAAAKLGDSERRVMSMAMIHEQLYYHDDMSSIDLAEYTRGLASHLVSAYTKSEFITYRLEVTPTVLAIEQSVPCGLILNELITNALKYAYPDGRGEILVRISSQGDNVSITVADQGVGVPPDLDRQTSKSLGMTLVHILTKQLGGSLEISSPPGASFTVHFTRQPIRHPLADVRVLSTSETPA
jgi:PAS domain S-box-containing protein